MTDLVPMDDLIEPLAEFRSRGEMRSRAAPRQPCGAGATVALEPDEFRAELACGCPQPGWEREPYEEGFAAYASGAGLLDNPYHGDNCAHQQWANGWSQARDQVQRQARQ